MNVRAQPCGSVHAQTRLASAEKFLEVAQLIEEEVDPALASVTASLAILAGIAASDAACCKVLGRRSRGESHYDAVSILSLIEGAEPAAEALRRLISLKDGAQYGLQFVSRENQKMALRQAERLVGFAREVLRR